MRRLGKYEILSELGRGGMGVVYKARDPFIDRPVALKTITSNLAGNNELLQRFYQEARSAGIKDKVVVLEEGITRFF